MTPTSPVTLSREERIERAEKEVIRLCNGRDRSFRMTIPAEPDRDSDLLLMDGLKAGREALAEAASRAVTETPEGLDETDLMALFRENGWALAISDGEPFDPWQRVAFKLLAARLTAHKEEHGG